MHRGPSQAAAAAAYVYFGGGGAREDRRQSGAGQAASWREIAKYGSAGRKKLVTLCRAF